MSRSLLSGVFRIYVSGYITACLVVCCMGCDDSSSSATSDTQESASGSGSESAGVEAFGGSLSGGSLSGGSDVSGGSLSGGSEVSGGSHATSDEHSYPDPPQGYPRFRFPVSDDDRGQINADPVFGVDHDTRSASRIQCLNYEGRGFPHCYDGHLGSDFMLLGGFDAMDSGSAQVVAALAGEVIAVEDGNYDRCRADLLSGDISCDGEPMRANYVTVRHEGGWRSSYYHLKRGSVLVERGQRVDCGEPLGLIGSSGYSSAPHLHFEVEDATGLVWDPYAGPESQPFSLWVYQPSGDSSPDGSLGEPSESSASLPSSSCSSPSR